MVSAVQISKKLIAGGILVLVYTVLLSLLTEQLFVTSLFLHPTVSLVILWKYCNDWLFSRK